jgi:predicted nuclease of predicted toxin-antitoxin system
MKFLVDAHLPRRLAYQLRAFGHEAVHTLDTFTIQRVPYKLLLVSTGNITNAALETLVTQYMVDITAAFVSHDFVELTRTMLIIHV